MRIAHIEAGRHLYGGAAQVRYLTEGLTSRGIENVLLCAPGSEIGAAARAAHVIELPMRGDLDIALLPRLARELERVAPDVVHVHSRRGADLYGGLAAALAGIPAVVTRRVDSHEPAALARLKYRPYRVVVALSRAIERQLLDAGLPAEKTALIPSAVDTQRFAPDSTARGRVRTAFGLPADALVVAVVAQLIERKRHAWLLSSLPALVREQPMIRVLCFGRGPLERTLRRQVAALGLTERVVFAGFRNDLPELLPGIDLLVHPAEREGFGLALLEAASSGVPVVACAVGGVPDVVAEGETGLLVARDDFEGLCSAMRSLLADERERRRLGAAARRHAERRFGLGALVAAHHSLYARVLGEPATAFEPTVSP
jgi:glycosyltransferase involved in cell wall biosynthesis